MTKTQWVFKKVVEYKWGFNYGSIFKNNATVEYSDYKWHGLICFARSITFN